MAANMVKKGMNEKPGRDKATQQRGYMFGLKATHTLEIGVACHYRGHYIYAYPSSVPIDPILFATKTGVNVAGIKRSCASAHDPCDSGLVDKSRIHALERSCFHEREVQREHMKKMKKRRLDMKDEAVQAAYERISDMVQRLLDPKHSQFWEQPLGNGLYLMQLRKVFHLLVRLNAKSGFEYKHASILFTRDNIVVENSNDTKSANNSERTDDTENGVLVEFIEPENPVFQQRATSVLFASAQEKLSRLPSPTLDEQQRNIYIDRSDIAIWSAGGGCGLQSDFSSCDEIEGPVRRRPRVQTRGEGAPLVAIDTNSCDCRERKSQLPTAFVGSRATAEEYEAALTTIPAARRCDPRLPGQTGP
ncbi:hypothetical protein COCSADRAFT_345260 [Bipolaris sorokiniana ND90Pr]|nr:uncharacterized protein COCSADRAFT_345260 [Bipolaris sorokiniana ND90Pr]EMD61128.1 hypothetical protein COCSADRAFT_345260 [Bipolaris sorokiniana ND90Pr]